MILVSGRLAIGQPTSAATPARKCGPKAALPPPDAHGSLDRVVPEVPVRETELRDDLAQAFVTAHLVKRTRNRMIQVNVFLGERVARVAVFFGGHLIACSEFHCRLRVVLHELP